jgi:hypothetical protein
MNFTTMNIGIFWEMIVTEALFVNETFFQISLPNNQITIDFIISQDPINTDEVVITLGN